jgi:hypothetical protein
MFNLFKRKRTSTSADDPITGCATLAFKRAVQLSEFLMTKLSLSSEPTLDQKDRVLINNLCLEGVSFRIDLKDMHRFPSGIHLTGSRTRPLRATTSTAKRYFTTKI